MKREESYGIYRMFKNEYRKAVQKHPLLCDKLVTTTMMTKRLPEIRELNDKMEKNGTSVGTSILTEEIAEAMEAYNQRDYDNCVKELVQCIVVIVRMIFFVKKEKENGIR